PALRNPIDVQRLPGFDRAGVLVAGQSVHIGFAPSGPDQFVPRQATDRAPVLPVSLRTRSASKASNLSAPAVGRQTATLRNGRLVSATTVANVLPGRRATPTKLAHLTQTLPLGTTIKFLVPRDK